MSENKNLDRKKFLSTIGIGAGIGLISSLAVVKLFKSKIYNRKNVSVKIHPSAIKRNKV
ncbi:MAG: hypothetical protein AB1521_10015 [Bacteroidota bacterium]